MSDNDNNKFHVSEKFITFVIKNNNFNCSAFLSNHKNIKINASDILKLTYNSTIAQYNNWLANVKTNFNENFARFFINH